MALDGTELDGQRITVQFARGPRQRDPAHGGPPERNIPRPRRTVHRMTITGLPVDTSWQVSFPFPNSLPFSAVLAPGHHVVHLLASWLSIPT